MLWLGFTSIIFSSYGCVTALAQPLLSLLDHHVIMFKIQMNLKWGLLNPSSKWNSTRVKIKSFQWTGNALLKCSSSLPWSRTSAKNGAHFSRTLWIFELNHKVFAFGHLNAINIFKCPNNLESIFGLLELISEVPINIFSIL